MRLKPNTRFCAARFADHGTLKRRPFLRFYACKPDFSNVPPDTALPDEVVYGTEPRVRCGVISSCRSSRKI